MEHIDADTENLDGGIDTLQFELLGDVGKDSKKSRCVESHAYVNRSRTLRRESKNIYRRAFSESNLLDIFDRDLENGSSYHVISGGDIDGRSFLNVVIRQQNLSYLLFSTWCMSLDDVLQIRDWLEGGKIGRVDAYCGEIFRGTYGAEYQALKEVVNACDGRVCIFRNYSKVIAGISQKFAFAITSSANMNTNPITENTLVSFGHDVFEFYKDFFDGIKNFERDYDTWEAWKCS